MEKKLICILVMMIPPFSTTPSYINPAQSFFCTHGHKNHKTNIIHACPDDTCLVDPEADMYFWRYSSQRFPAMFLTSDENSIIVTSDDATKEIKDIKISRQLRQELEQLSKGENLTPVRVRFEDGIKQGHYTLLLNDEHRNYVFLPMICERRHKHWWEKKSRIACTIEKKQIRKIHLPI